MVKEPRRLSGQVNKDVLGDLLSEMRSTGAAPKSGGVNDSQVPMDEVT
jgi:hypothetical protein